MQEWWEKMSTLIKTVEARAFQPTGTRGSMQLKGTDICMDVYCTCGKSSHFDGMFMHAIQCPHCDKRYHVSTVVQLVELTPEEAANEWYASPKLDHTQDH